MKDETQVAIILPDEVKTLAEKVPEQKQKEVKEVLTQVFAGTSEWDAQIEAIEVKDINDVMSINLADVARKNAKTARLKAERLFDEKRATVQIRMVDDKLEDSLWLKSKQIMQLQFKAIEEKAAYKANFAKRHEAEQRELKVQLRLEKIIKFNPEANRTDIEFLSDEMFNTVLASYEKTHNEKIEAEKKAEEERLAKIEADKIEQNRKLEIAPYAQFVTESSDLRNMDNEKYVTLITELKKAKTDYDKEQAKIAAENKRLKEAAEAKEKQLEKERLERERLAKIESAKAAELKAKQDKKLADQKAAADKKIEEEKKKAEKLAAELKAKQDSELQAKKEEESRIQAELNKGDEAKVKDLLSDLEALKTKYAFKAIKNQNMYSNTCTLIDKVIDYINK